MKSYQKEEVLVKIINEEKLLEKAGEGLLNLSIELGLEVLTQMLEADVVEYAGEKGRHNKDRTAYRHGSENTKVVLGGEKRQIKKPRVRSTTDNELPLPTLKLFQDEKHLSKAVLMRLLSGVSTRKYEKTVDTISEDSYCTSKSEVNRKFIKSLEELMDEFFNRRLKDEYPVIMIDGIHENNMAIIAAMGITKGGRKHILGLTHGATENNEIVKSLLNDLINRGLHKDIPRLFVIDGAKALHKGIKDVFGEYAVFQR